MKILDAEFVKGFIRMANDGWEQGWHERNGGNLSYRIRPEEVHWIRPDLALIPGEERRCQVRIRYRQPLQGAVLHARNDGLYIEFDKPQRGITPGQFAVWYADDGEMTGSGVIDS